ncbi:FecCD family ABC transporter permease [Ostreibacterium oceani]|uniref:Iron chelate uptake ABC transporter family permease subunit n=1 Tax=Ostreibacterium oceani TaxID=2654998 RepID=A0A6N7EXW3_9GAMM|nr:iron ABC transporter permease [Ostreibacterium oceani]MPV86380.1 iron chelate uptake ABC transporter family permease subunit [Ostreibacterium oceani]
MSIKSKIFWLISIIVLILSIGVAVSIGSVHIPLRSVWNILLSQTQLVDPQASTGRAAIVWDIRLPRVLLAGLVGAGLGLIGCVLQSITRNPLADPHLLGISSGAAFGAITALLHTGLIFGLLTVPLFAFLGAILATGLVLSVASFTRSTGADRLILTGVAISFVIMALANLLIFLGDPRATHTVVFWMLGGLGLAQWSHLIWPTLILCVAFAWFMTHAHRLNVMTLGDETASTLGISVNAFRVKTFILAALVTGVMVAFSGVIGFVGLMIPHIARLLVGGNYTKVLPASMLMGAFFLIWADIAARTLMQPEEIPVGIITGFMGGLFFIFLLRCKRVS